MGFHHVALATNDIAATHHFYTLAMRFTLVKASIGPTPEGGWAKHVFYDTGGNGLIAFWDLHVPGKFENVKSAMSTDMDLPSWVNHLAFDAPSLEALDEQVEYWQGLGIDVIDIEHDFCRSVYTTDPNGTLVEWCCDTRPFTDEEIADANRMILANEPGDYDPQPNVKFYPGDESIRPRWGVDLEVPA